MESVEQLQLELTKKNSEYEQLVDTYKYAAPKDPAEVFRLKRQIVQTATERKRLEELLGRLLFQGP